jgi:DNA-directed RNA polymerase subunit M/transcription elongation factor TFIIS
MVVSSADALLAFRLRLVRFLEVNGMDAASARTLDSQAAQWASGDCKELAFFANQCFKCWQARKHTTVHIADVIQSAVQSLKPKKKKDMPVKDSLTEAQRAAKDKRLQEWREARTEDTICPHCKSLEYSTSEYGNQNRAADEGATAMRKCDNPGCFGKEWKVTKNQINSKKKVNAARGVRAPRRQSRRRQAPHPPTASD